MRADHRAAWTRSLAFRADFLTARARSSRGFVAVGRGHGTPKLRVWALLGSLCASPGDHEASFRCPRRCSGAHHTCIQATGEVCLFTTSHGPEVQSTHNARLLQNPGSIVDMCCQMARTPVPPSCKIAPEFHPQLLHLSVSLRVVRSTHQVGCHLDCPCCILVKHKCAACSARFSTVTTSGCPFTAETTKLKSGCSCTACPQAVSLQAFLSGVSVARITMNTTKTNFLQPHIRISSTVHAKK